MTTEQQQALMSELHANIDTDEMLTLRDGSERRRYTFLPDRIIDWKGTPKSYERV